MSTASAAQEQPLQVDLFKDAAQCSASPALPAFTLSVNDIFYLPEG
jgi:hypothetical protein